MAPADDKNALLQQLHIDRTTPERRGIPRAWWLGGAALLVVLAAVLAAVWLLRGGPSVAVQVANAEPPATQDTTPYEAFASLSLITPMAGTTEG